MQCARTAAIETVRLVDEFRVTSVIGVSCNLQATIRNGGQRRARAWNCRINNVVKSIGCECIGNLCRAGRVASNAKSALSHIRGQPQRGIKSVMNPLDDGSGTCSQNLLT